MGSIVDSRLKRLLPSASPAMPGTAPNSGNENIHLLVVEDEDLLREAICNSLLEDGYQVIPAVSAEEARSIIESKVVHLIVLDLLLPGLDGFDYIVELRASPKTRHLPIIVVTARDNIPHRVQGLDLGADDYMTKPFALTELKARIRAQLRQSKDPEPPPAPASSFGPFPYPDFTPGVLQFSRLRLEKTRRATFLMEDSGIWNAISLTPREFDILWFLAENKEISKTRDEIIIAVTPESHAEEEHIQEAVTKNTIDVHIHKLRKKIGPKWIRTVYRAGARFVDPYE